MTGKQKARLLPDKLETLWREQGLGSEEIVFVMPFDRKPDSVDEADGFVDSYAILTRNKLVIFSDREGISEKTFKGYVVYDRKRKRQESAEPRQAESWRVETFSIANIESIYTVHLIASGLLVVKTDREEKAVAAFTNSHMRDAAKLTRLFDKVKKGETIEEEEHDEEGRDATCPTCGMMYPERGRAICPRCVKKKAIFMRLLSFAGKYRGMIALIILLMLLNSATALVIPYFQGKVLFDEALGGTGRFAGQIGLVILIIIVFRSVSLLFSIWFGIMSARLAANVVYDLKSRVFTALQRLSLSFFQKRQTGQLMTRVNNDAMELQHFFIDGIPYFLVNAMNIVGITAILLVMDWRLTLICFLPMPLVIYIIRKVFPKLYRLSWRRHRKMSRLNSLISDSMRGTRVVKAFGKERREVERFGRANAEFAGAEMAYSKMGSTVSPVLQLVTQIGGVIIWAVGGWKVMGGSLTFGDIMAFVNYIMMLYGPIQYMNNVVNWWSYSLSAAQRIFEIQDAIPEVQEKENAIRLDRIKGHIEVKNVTFGYEVNKPIIRNVSMEAKPGQMIGVVGHSGAGKSTLVNLISRLYDVQEGEIRIDGINVKDLSAETLHKHIGIVSQEVYVFMGTIAENIAYAKPGCSLDEIVQAAKLAKAHDFIEQLPDGYDTMVGTGGHNLSGGEKQRISIARAILHNPRILILDEATASLDTETELQIQEALETLMEGRTTIAIAHRLSTLRNADYLVVMERGQVVEAGTHDELMEKQGVYHRLVKKHDEALKMRGVG